jgi:hypothetical protein
MFFISQIEDGLFHQHFGGSAAGGNYVKSGRHSCAGISASGGVVDSQIGIISADKDFSSPTADA